MIRAFIQFIGSVAAFTLAAFILYFGVTHAPIPDLTFHRTEPAATTTSAITTPTITATKATTTKVVTAKPKSAAAPSKPKAPNPQNTASDSEIYRIQNPYDAEPQSTDAVNQEARAALVNILCETSSGSLHPVSGSGVIIDPRGVILTNAHVAQYVLLASQPNVGLTCMIRTGSPAQIGRAHV